MEPLELNTYAEDMLASAFDYNFWFGSPPGADLAYTTVYEELRPTFAHEAIAKLVEMGKRLILTMFILTSFFVASGLTLFLHNVVGTVQVMTDAERAVAPHNSMSCMYC